MEKRATFYSNTSKFLLLFICLFTFKVNSQISTFPYFQDFETNTGGWSAGGTLSDWTYGTPSKPTITGAGGGLKCWINGGLNLTGVGYNYNEVSYVTSPVFNFSSLSYPWISFKLFWETEKKWDGGNLQYSINGGTTWVRVGNLGDPIDCMNDNWYNTNNISQLVSLDPSKTGWGGNHYPTTATGTGNANATGAGCQLGSGSMTWLVAKHCLTGLAGQPNVMFRFTFGAGFVCNYYDGLAFDDILIQEGLQNAPNFSFTCSGAPSTINFTSILPACPNPSTATLSWNFGDPASGPSNISTALNPSHTFSSPGTYTISLTQTGGPCNPPGTITHTVTIMNSVITSSTNVTCFGGNNGSAVVTPSNGNSPYTYSWSPIGGTTATGTNLTAGNYTVTVQDALGCKKTASVTITQPPIMNVAITSTNVLCNSGNSGIASAAASGGTPGYTYSWTPSGGTSSVATGLAAGNYSVIVTDSHGCITNSPVTITQPSAISLTINSNNTTCGNAVGSATVTATGGTPNYTYSWSAAASTSSVCSSLSAGFYSVTVTDNHGCTNSISTNISSSGGPTIAITGTNVACFGSATGIASATVTGGATPYTYSWSPSGGTGMMASNLIAGNYNLIATDANGCIGNASILITQPIAPLTAVVSSTNVTCNSLSNGSASVSAGGGTAGYTYSWSPAGGSGILAVGLTPNIYSVTVTDSKNCTVTNTISITQPNALTASVSISNVTCNGSNNGSATVTASGGNLGYSYSWMPSGGTGSISTPNLSAGNYSVIVTDLNGCSKTTSLIINQPGALITTTTSNNVLCNGQATGSVSVIASGGVGSYSYNWQPSATTNSNVTGLSAGIYTVIVTDANGCSKTAFATITQPSILNVNPTNNQNICAGQSATLSANVSGGTPAYSVNWLPVNINSPSLIVTPSITTTYSVIATDANGCTSLPATIIVSVAPTVSLVVNNNITVCSDALTTLTTNATGGNGNYQYNWSPGNTTNSNITFVATNNQQFTVTVSDGCSSVTKTITVTVTIKPNIKLFPDVKGCAPLCINFYDSTLIKSGVINLWDWNFSNGETSSSASPDICFTSAGSYSGTLNVITVNNCAYKLAEITGISVLPKPNADFTSDKGFDATEFNSDFLFTNASSNYSTLTWYAPNIALYGNSINVSFPEIGSYPVTLIASNDYGCEDTITKIIKINPEFTFYAPNCFTPNGNSLNDKFLPMGMGWDTNVFSLSIFDRWGEQIYSTNDFSAGWDGTYKSKGEKVQDDIYVWKVHLKDIYHKQHDYIGHVSIIK